MKYQLVLQLPSPSMEDDYELLLTLEEKIEQGLGDLGEVDGHDIGSGEMNIFIHTDHPQSAFERAMVLLRGKDGLEQLKAGYRDFDEDNYVPIYPKGLARFSVA